MMTDFSEPGGAFHSDNFTSNEAQTATIARTLATRRPGGVYIGVGPEQNFTLIAASRPRIAFILDIRRQAIVQHLMFKALFEIADDRADFLARLFSRPRPAQLDRGAPLARIWDAIRAAPADAERHRIQREEIASHLERRGLALSPGDHHHLDYVFKAFFELGPDINYGGYQQGLSTSNVNFARLSLAVDDAGEARGFLSSDESFQLIKSMQARNLIVPIEGDFAGPKALRAIGAWARSRSAIVDTFYISNVEQYLFGQTVARGTDVNGGFKAFYENAATLPINDRSAFVRVLSLTAPAPLCLMAPFLEVALRKPITMSVDARTCAGTLPEALPPSLGQAARERAEILQSFTDRVHNGKDIGWLQQVAASDEFLRREWNAAVGTDQVPATLRSDAYVRLGALGTPDALAAVGRVEESVRGQSLLAEPSLTGWSWPAPVAGSTATRMIALNAITAGDREYAAVLSDLYGPYAPFVLARSRGDARWRRPRLAGAPVATAPSFEAIVTVQADTLTIAFRRRPSTSDMVPMPPAVTVPIAALDQDSDGDGWTDLEERALGMRPDRADSDGDGIADGVDSTPLYKAAPGEASDEEAQIISRALFAAYGTSGSRYAIFVAPGHRPVQLFGHSGPMFFDVTLPSRTGCGRGVAAGVGAGPCPAIRGGAQVTWTIGRPSPTEASVSFTNQAAAGFRSTALATLRKIGTQWIVVEYRVTSIN